MSIVDPGQRSGHTRLYMLLPPSCSAAINIISLDLRYEIRRRLGWLHFWVVVSVLLVASIG